MVMTSIKTDSEEQMKTPFSRSHQHEVKLQTILSEAARLFNYQGTRATTLGNIADSIGLTKTSLYYYARNKSELVYKCYRVSCDAGDEMMAESAQHSKTGLECLLNFVKFFFARGDEITQRRHPHVAMLTEIPILAPEQRKEIEARVDRHFNTLLGFIQRGVEDGSITECAPIPTTQAFLSLINWSYVWYGRTPLEKRAASIEQLIGLIMHGITARPYPLGNIEFPELHKSLPAGFDRQEQNELKRIAFLRAGSMMFNQRGYMGTSLDEIASQLEVTKGAFYYHIKNKEDLLATGAGGSGAEKIELVLRYLFNIQHSDEGPLIRYRSLPSMNQAHRLSILQMTEEISHQLGELIAKGIEDGSIRKVDSSIIENVIAGAVDSAPGVAKRMQFTDNSRVSAEYLQLFFNGIAA
jgi:AcrR family transcriptional regulator